MNQISVDKPDYIVTVDYYLILYAFLNHHISIFTCILQCLNYFMRYILITAYRYCIVRFSSVLDDLDFRLQCLEVTSSFEETEALEDLIFTR